MQFDPADWDKMIMEKKTLTLLEFWAYNNSGHPTSIARVRLLSTGTGLAVEHRLLAPKGTPVTVSYVTDTSEAFGVMSNIVGPGTGWAMCSPNEANQMNP